MKTMRRGTALALFLLLTACGILESGKPARQVYLLQTPLAPNPSGQMETAPTLIISVTAVPGLDTDRILVLGHDAQLNPVANAHWPDHMPEVFTSIVRRYLSDSHQFRSVRRGSIARPEEWLLELELQAFYGTDGTTGATSAVILQLEGMLRCAGKQQVLNITERSPVDGDTLSVLVAAHQRVVDAAMPKLSRSLISTCSDPPQG